MDEKKIKFLQEINHGKIRGSQKILADKLGIKSGTVTKWFRENSIPSLDNIIKLAKTFNKTEEEIKEIFSIEDKKDDVAYSNFAIMKEIELIKEKMKRFETELELIKVKNDINGGGLEDLRISNGNV